MPGKDPTGTSLQRRLFRNAARLKLQRLEAMTRRLVIDEDMLALKPDARIILSNADKLRAFDQWFTSATYTLLVEPAGAWMRIYLQSAYEHGVETARKMLKSDKFAANPRTVEFHQQRALLDLQGIADDLIKRENRALLAALNVKYGRAMWSIMMLPFRHAAATSLDLLANNYVVQLHNNGRMDQFRLNGIKLVGVDPENAPSTHVHDAKKTGPGSRVPRSRTPSGRTIRRIRSVSRRLEALGRVDVQTAEDDKVCPICEEIADGGPYGIDEAQSLIPAHLNCRCSFVPAENSRTEDQMNAAA